MRSSIFILEDQLRAFYLERGFSITRTAQALRVCPMTVWNRLKDLNITIRPRNSGVSPETREKLSQAHKGMIFSSQHRANLSKMAKIRGVLRETIEAGVRARLAKPLSYKARQALLNQAYRMRDDKEYCQGVIKKTMANCARLPSGPEKSFIGLCSQYNLPFEYTGNGKIWIDGQNPDFINTDGKKQLVEILGNYWHNKEETQKRVEHYAKYGFECITIWENELKDENLVLSKLKKGGQ